MATVGEIMTRNLLTVEPGATIADVVRQMHEREDIWKPYPPGWLGKLRGEVYAAALHFKEIAWLVHLQDERRNEIADLSAAVQEATLRTWRHLHQFREGSCLRSWYLAIVANQCRTLARGRWWRVLRFADPPERASAGFDDATAALVDVRRALAELSFDHRLVLCLHYYLDLPHEEVARLTGVPVGTVKSRLHRATLQLRGRLEAPGRSTAPGPPARAAGPAARSARLFH